MTTYKRAGVDVKLSDKFTEFLQKKSKAIGGFAGLFDLKLRSHLAACWRLEARHEAGPQVRRRRQRALNEVGQEIAHPRINSR